MVCTTPPQGSSYHKLNYILYCCRIMNCPELQEMDEATRMDMGNAYAEEFWNGKTPEELYHEWLQAYSDRHTISCVLCAEQHRCGSNRLPPPELDSCRWSSVFLLSCMEDHQENGVMVPPINVVAVKGSDVIVHWHVPYHRLHDKTAFPTG